MKWKVIKLLAVATIIFSVLGAGLSSVTQLNVVQAAGTAFESLNQGEYVTIDDLDGETHLWRVVDALNRRVVYAGLDQESDALEWEQAKNRGDDFKVQFPSSIVEYSGHGLLTFEDVYT